jgi:hypothetical protein
VFGNAIVLQHAEANVAIGEPEAYPRFHQNVSCTIEGALGAPAGGLRRSILSFALNERISA